MTIKVEGMEAVVEALNARVNVIEGRTMGGLLAGGLKVEALSKRRVPVEYGKLRASGYSRKAMGHPLAVEIGFSAAYAVYVHENMEMKLAGQPRPSGLGAYWSPDGRPKFLESSVRELSDEFVKTVASHAKVGKVA